MTVLRRCAFTVSLGTFLLMSAGCQTLPSGMKPSTWWHYMQPHQWSKLNRWEGPSDGHSWYSINDPIVLSADPHTDSTQ